MTVRYSIASTLNHLLRPFDIRIVRAADIWRPLSQLGRQPDVTFTKPCGPPFLKAFQGRRVLSLQEQFDFAVVMPTTLRDTICDAIQSIFDQRFDGKVQLLIGIDAAEMTSANLDRVERLCRRLPDWCSILLFYPGYSTARRHGGLHFAQDGGSLRTMLTYLANSRYVAYLDDDNWWSPDHLSSLRAVLEAGSDWAYALRWYVHPETRRPICMDEWESVGPGKGVFRDGGGWVDPNCLAIDKISCEAVLRWWAIPQRNSPKAMDADRAVFRFLSSEFRGRSTELYSVFYEISEIDNLHSFRLGVIGTQRYALAANPLPIPSTSDKLLDTGNL